MLAAQDALNVQQGFPRDKNNLAPRLRLAWDINGDQQDSDSRRRWTLLRSPAAGHRLQLRHRRRRATAAGNPDPAGSPAPTALLNAAQVFQGTVVVCNFAGRNVPGV